MDFLIEGVGRAFWLLASGDAETWQAVALSLWTSLLAVGMGTLVGAPLGTYVGLARPFGSAALVFCFRVGMAMPTVVIGLLVFGLLSSRGPLGALELIYTPSAIVIGQTLLAAPIVASFAHASAAALDPCVYETVRTHGGTAALGVRVALVETRRELTVAVLSAFGRCITELGIALIVGGSVRYFTRTLPALVTLETSKGDFARAMAPGLILVLLACGAAVVAPLVARERRR